MMWLKKHWSTILLFMILLAGVGLLGYPTFADWWNSFNQSRAIAGYSEQVSQIDDSEYRKMLKDAHAYNKELLERGDGRFNMTDEEREKYNSILDITGTGIMGYVEIPKINVSLPIYHGTDEAILQTAIGHIEVRVHIQLLLVIEVCQVPSSLLIWINSRKETLYRSLSWTRC